MEIKRRPLDRPYLWFSLVCLAVLGWPLLDSASATARPVYGRVTGFQPGKSNRVDIVIEFPDGEEARKTTASALPDGTLVPCKQYTRRLSGARYYVC